jgi:hypothetical protein
VTLGKQVLKASKVRLGFKVRLVPLVRKALKVTPVILAHRGRRASRAFREKLV